MAKQYGQTWWGKKWLQALRSIDYSNRLPRGKTYANKGAVLDVHIQDNLIQAQVRGSRPQPYKQKIYLDTFSDFQREDILHIIQENPFLLSKLLQRELPTELYDQLNQIGVRIFPQVWEDLRAECSCPDWAVPCKHLAAVIYVMANEIDQNPFLVFQLHGLDILAEVQKLGEIDSQEGLGTAIPVLAELFAAEPDADEYAFRPELIQALDFSQIPESRATILQLLDEKPLFYPEKDFKEIVAKNYQLAAREVGKFQEIKLILEQVQFSEDLDRVSVYVDENFRYRHTKLSLRGEEISLDTDQSLRHLIDELQHINPARLPNYAPTVVALYLNFQFALFLLMRSAYLPEILLIKENKYLIRWIPALLIEEVRQIFDHLVKITPPRLLIYRTRKATRYAEAEEQVKSLLSLFLNHFASEYARNPRPYDYDEVFLAFYGLSSITTDSFDKKELPISIRKWLQKFNLRHKGYLPVLKVEEREEQGDFTLSFWIQNSEEAIQDLVPLRALWQEKKYQSLQLEVLQDLALLTDYLPKLKILIASKGEQELFINPIDFVDVLQKTIPALRLLGVQILLPKSLHKIVRPQLSMRLQAQGSSGKDKAFISFKELLHFDWQIALDDETLSPEEFLAILQSTEGLVKVRNQYVLIDEKEMKSLLAKLANPPELKEKELLKAGLSEDYEGAQIELDAKAQALFQSILQEEAIAPPEGLQATLRPYQQRGYAWLYKNARLGFGSLLADDMGLGKTIQVITLLLKFKEEDKLDKKKALIVVPTTLLTNWQKEIHKFAPALQTFIYHGANRELQVEENDVVITTYGIARSDEKILSKIKWEILVIDEAQNIKNMATAQTKAIKKIKAQHSIALSGTPVENRLSEYWSIFDFSNKAYLGSLKSFQEEFIKPIELERNQERLERFRKITAPFILRRVKSDKSIIQDLPDKIETNQICYLSAEQSALYQNVVDAQVKEIESEEGISRQGAIFQLMNALKQICNHPSHFLKKPQIDPALSGKTQMLLTLLENIYENGEKTLIFTQYKEMGDLLVKLIQQKFQHKPLWLHGGVSRKKRDQMVEDFQNKSHIKTMLLSLKAGGTGLNLTEANHVIHYDLWWNPAVESQATDRAYRIGQQKNVLVYRLITQGTFEEKIDEMIQAKKELAEMTVSTGENWIGNLSNEELKSIFHLEK